LLLLLLFKKKLTIYIISSIILLSVALTSQAVFEMLPDHQKRRIEVFTNPDKDPLDSGYNVMQSKLAIGSGGIYGKGFGQGAITQLKYVPKQ
jgi:rod shape determining protein RodA